MLVTKSDHYPVVSQWIQRGAAIGGKEAPVPPHEPDQSIHPLPSSLADLRVKAVSEYMRIIAESQPSPCGSR